MCGTKGLLRRACWFPEQQGSALSAGTPPPAFLQVTFRAEEAPLTEFLFPSKEKKKFSITPQLLHCIFTLGGRCLKLAAFKHPVDPTDFSRFIHSVPRITFPKIIKLE